MSSSLPSMPLIDRHLQILKLLYRYRFLNRPQIQHLIGHKSSSRLSVWLNQLTHYSFIRRYYTKSVHSTAAVYSLGTKGRQALLQTKDPTINKAVLDRVWREHLLSFQTRKHLMLVADTSIALSNLAITKHAQLTFYTKTELQGFKHLILPPPDAYFVLEEESGLTNRFFLEIIDDFPAREKLIKLVWNYFSYYQKKYWQTHAHKPFPHIILITPDARTSKMLYRLIQYKLKTEAKLTFLLLKRQDISLLGTKRNVLSLVKPQLNRRTQGPAARITY